MVFILPFFFLIVALIITRNNIFSLFCGLIANSIVYLYCFPLVSIYKLFFTVLPSFFVQIFSPQEYLYPVLFFIVVSCIIDLLKELRVFDSYATLASIFFQRVNKKIFDLSVIFSTGVFFLDDYLGLFGIKSFFSPLLKNTEEQKMELAQYSVLVDASPVLFFFSTWSVVIIKQIEFIKNSLFGCEEFSGMYYFLRAKKYFFYPILLYVGFLIRLFWKKNSVFIINKNIKTENKKIFMIDIVLFLILPFSMLAAFVYHLYFLGNSFDFLDVSLVMFQGAMGGFFTTFFLVRYFKSVSIYFLVKFFFSVIKDSILGIFKLTLCWLFSKITYSILSSYPLLSLPITYAVYYPAIYFLVSLLVALILGSEWGAVSIMISLLLFAKEFSIHFLLLLLGAIISGVIAGAHLSPVSNTTMMQAAVFELDSFRFYLKRFSFVLTIISISFILYIVFGFIYCY